MVFLLVLAPALVAVGVNGLFKPSEEAPADSESSGMEPVEGQSCPNDKVADTDAACEPLYSDSPPYRGPGPHSILVVSAGSAEVPATEGVPEEWRPRDSAGELDYQEAQLVVCEYVESTTERKADKCEYTTGDVLGLLISEYTYEVVEARTTELVTSFELEGDLCPVRVRQAVLPDGQIAGRINDDGLWEQLRETVERPL